MPRKGGGPWTVRFGPMLGERRDPRIVKYRPLASMGRGLRSRPFLGGSTPGADVFASRSAAFTPILGCSASGPNASPPEVFFHAKQEALDSEVRPSSWQGQEPLDSEVRNSAGQGHKGPWMVEYDPMLGKNRGTRIVRCCTMSSQGRGPALRIMRR